MTTNGVMALFCIISPNSVASGKHCVKVVEDVIVKKFTFAISSPDEFLVIIFPEYRFCLCCKLLQWVRGQSQATKYIS